MVESFEGVCMDAAQFKAGSVRVARLLISSITVALVVGAIAADGCCLLPLDVHAVGSDLVDLKLD